MRILLVVPLFCLQGFAQTSPPPPPAQPQPFYSDPQPQLQTRTCDVPQSRRNPLAVYNFCIPEQTKKASAPTPSVGAPENTVVPAPATSLARPSECSIPLLNVAPVETHDRMIVSVPLKESRDTIVVAPAPPCDDKKK